MTPRGAALPKDTSAVRSSIRGNVKVVCRHFPECDGYAYLSAAAIRSRRIPTCYCGSGELIPASPAACMIPDLWYCRKCYGVNERLADGTLGWFKAGPFSPEAEKCNGLAQDRKVATVRKVAPAQERVGAAPVDSIPF